MEPKKPDLDTAVAVIPQRAPWLRTVLAGTVRIETMSLKGLMRIALSPGPYPARSVSGNMSRNRALVDERR